MQRSQDNLTILKGEYAQRRGMPHQMENQPIRIIFFDTSFFLKPIMKMTGFLRICFIPFPYIPN